MAELRKVDEEAYTYTFTVEYYMYLASYTCTLQNSIPSRVYIFIWLLDTIDTLLCTNATRAFDSLVL